MNRTINIEILDEDNMDKQVHFNVYMDGRLRYNGMSAAGVIDVIKEVHDVHEHKRGRA